MKSSLRQGLLLARRLGVRWGRSRTMLVLAACVVVASSTTSALGFLSANVQRALDRDVSRFLGAPLVIRASQPIDTSALEESLGDASHWTRTASFTVGATGPERYHSVALKAVSDGYPVAGDVALKKDGIAQVAHTLPEGGTAWLDQRAMRLLGAKVGDWIHIGQAEFRVVAELAFEPDRLTQLQHTLPRVLIHRRDLSNVGLDLNNGRGDFRVLVDGSEEVLGAVEAKAARVGYEVLSPASGAHPFSRMSQRASRFLGLVSVLVLLLCGSACAVLGGYVVRRYARPAAVLRCLGVDRRTVTLALTAQVATLALVSGLLGVVLGWASQPLLARLLMPHLVLRPAPPDVSVSLVASAFSLLILVGFVYPRLHALSRVPPAAALGGHVQPTFRASLTVISVLACATGLIWMLSDNAQLTAILGASLIVVSASAWAAGWLIAKLAAQSFRLTRGWLRIALQAVGRSAARNAIPTTTIALSVMAFLSTTMLRSSLLDTYQEQRFNHDGNTLFSRLPGTDIGHFRRFADERGWTVRSAHPAVRAMLVEINDIPVDKALNRESDTREETRSPVRLSFADAIPENNELTDGAWPKPGSGSVSVDAEVMSDMGLVIGDTLTFAIGDHRLRAAISSRRGFVGGGSSITFWFMFAPDTLSGFPKEYLGGLYLPEPSRDAMAALAETFPDLIVTDLEQYMGRMRSIMVAITRTLNVLAGLLLLAAAMVVAATATASTDYKHTAGNLLRTLGASRGQVQRIWLVERAVTGLVAALVGVVGAHVVAELIFHYQFNLPYAPNWFRYTVIPVGFACAFALVETLLGHRALRRPPLRAVQAA